MKKKLFSFFFFAVIILGASSPMIDYSLARRFNKEKKLNTNEDDPLAWKSEMDAIYDNPSSDYNGNFVDYFSDSKTYYLKEDINYQSTIDSNVTIYGENANINLVANSTFNGDNHEIQNRYNQSELETFINENYQIFEDFSENKSDLLNKIFLFNLFDNEKVINLTFNNSPFIVNETKGKTLMHNVNLINIKIEELNLKINAIDTKGISSKQNTFGLPLFGFKIGANTTLENSFFKEISFSGNTINLTQSDETRVLGLNFVLSLFMYISSDNTVTSIPLNFRNLEYSNWSISNNKFTTDKWDSNYINKKTMTFTPFFIGGASFRSDDYYLANKETNSKKVNSFKENTVIVSNIFFNNFEIKRNDFDGELSFNFILLPMFNDDDLVYLSFKTILLNKITIDSGELYGDNYITRSVNTILTFSNLIYSEEISDNLINEIKDSWNKKSKDVISSNEFKEFNFSSSYWDVTDGKDLELLTTSKIKINPNIIMGIDNKPYLQVVSEINNYFLTYLKYSVVKFSDGGEPETILNKEFSENDDLSFVQKNFDLEFPLDDSLSFEQNDNLEIDIWLSRNESSKLTYTINTNQINFLIYDFTNDYNSETNELNYSFSISDIFHQIDSWKLTAYHKSKILFKVSNEDKNNTNKLLSGDIKNLKLKNNTNLYFIFEVTFLIHDKKETKALLPEKNSNFRIGTINYIDKFVDKKNSWIHYNWWVLLILLIFLIFLIIILLVLMKLKKNSKEMHEVEHAMAIWAEEHQDDAAGIQLFEEFLENNYHRNDYENNDSSFNEEDINEIQYHPNHNEEQEEYFGEEIIHNDEYYSENDFEDYTEEYNEYYSEEDYDDEYSNQEINEFENDDIEEGE